MSVNSGSISGFVIIFEISFNKMNIYFSGFFSILFIVCTLICGANGYEKIVSIDSNACQMALLSYKEALPSFFEAIDEDDINKLLKFKDISLGTHIDHKNGRGLLYQAAYLGKAEIVHALVSEIGIDVNIQDSKNGLIALHYAVLNEEPLSRLDTIYTLIHLGTDADILNNLKYVQDGEDTITPTDYSTEQRIKAIELTMPPYNISLSQMAKLLQVKYSTFETWVIKYKKENDIPIKSSSYPEEVRSQAIKMSIEGRTYSQIAEELGVSRSTVAVWCHPFRKELHQRLRRLKAQAIEMHESGKKIAEIAKKLDVGRHTVLKWIPLKQRYKKLKAQAIEMYESKNISITKIAKKLKVGRHTVSQWVSSRQGYQEKLKAQAIEMYESEPISITKIAKKLKVGRHAVSQWVSSRQGRQEKLKAQAIEMHESGKKIVEIAKKLGKPERTVSHWILSYKKEKNISIQKPHPSNPNKAQAIKMHESGKKIAEIAKELKTPKSTVNDWLRHHKGDKRDKGKNKRYRELKVQAIKMYKSSIDEIQIAKDLKVPKSTVDRWLRPHKKNYKQQRYQELEAQAIKMYESDKKIAEIAKELHVAITTVRRWLRPHKKRRHQRRQELKAQAIKMHESGINGVQIAKDLKVSKSTINYWLRPYKEKQGTLQTRVFHSQESINEIIKMVIEEGKTVQETAEKLEIPESTVSSRVYRYKQKQSLEIETKEQYPPEMQELVVSQIIEDGDSIAEVAEEWSISKNLVSLWYREYQKSKKEETKTPVEKPEKPGSSPEKGSFAAPPKKDHQQKPSQSKSPQKNIDEREWISARTIFDDSLIKEAVEKVLSGSSVGDVANESGINEELLKLRVREHKFRQMRENVP